MKIGLATFGMPPEYNRKSDQTNSRSELEIQLENLEHDVIPSHIHTAAELSETLLRFRLAGVECLVVVLGSWTRIALVVNLVRSLAVPSALHARTTGGFKGVTALTAASASLREVASSGPACLHARFRDGMEGGALKWLDAVNAYNRMRTSRLMCWGGAYGANMPYTRSDPDWLENSLIAEVMYEQEVVLTDRAEQILAETPRKVEEFLEWAGSHGLETQISPPMCTRESLGRQAALYLAARERLSELEGENISGVSLKCHFELSTTHWGCTGCLIPAFLPFPEGPDGAQRVVPVACEGDLNGLVSLVMLHAVNPEVPPLFGDFVEYNDSHVLLRNCGSGSVYWAGMSNDPGESLPRTRFLPNMHGTSGAAVNFETPASEAVTACRLFRLGGVFHLFVATGQVIAETPDTRYQDPWPHTRVDFGLDPDLLFQVYPCNHSSLTTGDCAGQIEWVARFAGIHCHTVRTDDDLRTLRDEILRSG